MRVRLGVDQQLRGVSSLTNGLPQPKRRALLGLLASGATGGLWFIGSARAADALSIKLDWSPHPMHCSFHLATERGWFKKAGLDVQMEDGNGSTATVSILGGGTGFDIGHAALAPMAIGTSKGLPLVSVAGFLRKGEMGILVDQKLRVTKLEQLQGKKINYTAGSLEGPFVEPFFNLNKIAPSSINLVNVTAAAKLSTYVQGSVDGIITSVPTFYVMLKKTRPVDAILFADHGLNLPGFGLFARAETLKAKGDAVKRLTSLLCSTWTYIFDGHEDEAARAFMAQRPKSGTNREEIIETLAVYKPFFFSEFTKNQPIGIQADADWQATLKQMEGAKVIPAGTKPSDYFTNAYIDHAFGDKIVRGT